MLTQLAPPTSPVTVSPIARGPNFVYAREFVLENHGPEVWEKVLAGLEPADLEIWTSHLVVTGRYPFVSLLRMTEVLCGLTELDGCEELSEMYSHIAYRSLNTIYRFFLRLSQPSFVISNYPTLWSRFFESGEVVVLEAKKGHAKLEFWVEEIFLQWLPPACLGYSTRAIELAGGREVRLEEIDRARVGDGQVRVVFSLDWEE